MGTHNRERRRKKKARRDRRERSAPGGARAGGGRWTSLARGLAVDIFVCQVAEAVLHAEPGAGEMLDVLVSGPPGSGGRRLVAKALRDELTAVVEALASWHWYPSELVRQARRRAGAAGAVAAAHVVRAAWLGGAAGSVDPAWHAEAAGLGEPGWVLQPGTPTWRADVDAGVRLLGVLRHLPSLPELRSAAPPAGGRDTTAQGRALEKARHLLSKAESTTFPDEAEALTAKAQELLARHSIDRAAVEGADRSQRPAGISARRLWIDDPYVTAKAQLLHEVATANRCRAVLVRSVGMATVAGHEDDLDTVELLFTSLLVQATTQMTAAGARKDGSGRSRTRSFRHSFLVAFAVRIGQRLKEAEEASMSAGEAAHGGAFLPVLASRAAAAEELVDELFPDLELRGARATHAEGWAAGTLAADLSSLTVQPELFDAVA